MLSLGSLSGSLGTGQVASRGAVRYAFTDREGGVSRPPYDTLNLSFEVGDDAAAVARNRELVLARAGVGAAVWLRAQHGAEVALVGLESAPVQLADGLVTTTPGLALVALAADCVPVVLADPRAGVVAVAHCGRPGLLAGIIQAVVEAMRAAGAREVSAAVGPAVCGECYEVPAEMASEVAAAVPAAASRGRSGAPALDIVAGVAAQLRENRVDVVRRVGRCTREDPALFSYRRDRVTGRLGGLVWRSE